MTMQWNKGFDLETIAEELNSARSVKKDGSVSFSNITYDDCFLVLVSAAKFVDEVPEIERSRLVRKGIWRAAKRGVISVRSLREGIRKEARDYLSAPLERYVIASQISVSNAGVVRRIRIGEAIISLGPGLPRTFAKSREQMASEGQVAHSLRSREEPRHYWYIRASVPARSSHEGGAKALRAIDLLRGIWNFCINERMYYRRSTSRAAVNQIVLGPLHTLHWPNGHLATREHWWYEPNYIRPVQVVNFGREWRRISTPVSHIRKRLRVLSFGPDLEAAMCRYVRALDEADYEVSIIRLWSVLETLTGTGYKGYDATVERVANLYADSKFHKQVLNHIRRYRNHSVHAGGGSDGSEGVLHQVRRYVEWLIRFLLGKGFSFESLHHAQEFLGLGTNIEGMKRRRQLLDWRIHFCRPPDS